MTSFPEAVKIGLAKYADFSGRARRSEFWYFVLWTFLVSLVASILDSILGTRWGSGSGLIETVCGLALLLPSLAVGARRLHDSSRSGWWLLIGLIPCVGFIVLLIFFVQDSHPDNQYGPSPKAAGRGYPGMPPQPSA
jgi:uncharacterized membrane protein YhaH (DUF805 family)